VTTRFLYDGQEVLLEKQGSTTTGTYTYGNALLRKDSEYSLYDGLGSARAVTNASQSVTRTMGYTAFGQLAYTSGSSGTNYLFGATSGYRNDGDWVFLVGARYYDPQIGRFLTRDTYLDQKPYLYCNHDPINVTDPSGHMPNLLDKVIGFIENGPGGSLGVFLRGVAIFAPFWVGAGVAVYKYKKRWKKTNPPGSIGSENGGTRESQRRMVEKWSDPEDR
jgi:RHS repeat-associated protein